MVSKLDAKGKPKKNSAECVFDITDSKCCTLHEDLNNKEYKLILVHNNDGLYVPTGTFTNLHLLINSTHFSFLVFTTTRSKIYSLLGK